jgi:hypothetical protein
VKQVQDVLERPLALENPSSYVAFGSSTMSEWEFLKRLAEEADCALLLDVNNVYVSAFNHGFDPEAYIDAIPADRVVQYHLAGHTNKGTHIIDTHSAPAIEAVWALRRPAVGPDRVDALRGDEAIPPIDDRRGAQGGAARAARPSPRGPMAPELALGGLQRWMQSLIVHPGPVDEAVASPEAASLVRPDRLAEVLLPSATLTPTERIGIYHGMYILRMVEALESDYPALAHFLGEKRWAALVRDYVERHPSRSHTLNVLGRALPSFLLETSDLPRRGFCHDLARLELAVTEVFDAEETPRLGEAELLSVPAEAWDGARLVPSAALRLLKLGWTEGALI